ncbi:MAG: TIGR02206 family membrane protein [Propionibacteriaceae bacterium]|nr:TIGR02206 family membrane protein [Propionibacteriaceae bacterium]
MKHLFEYFWSSPYGTPEELWFGQFTLQHLAALVAMVVLIAAVVWIYRRSSIHRRKLIRLVVGICVLSMELIIRQVGFVVTGIYSAGILPLHACAAATFCVFIDSIKPNSWCREYLYAIGSWGALCALIFPDWADQPLMNLFTWQSFLAHGFLVAYILMILVAGEFRPSIHNLWKVVVIMAIFVIPSVIANNTWGTNFWFLASGSQGSPLAPLQQMAGSYYIPVLAVLLTVVWLVMYLPWLVKKSPRELGGSYADQ